MSSPSERFRWIPRWVRRLPILRRWFWRRSGSPEPPGGLRDKLAELCCGFALFFAIPGFIGGLGCVLGGLGLGEGLFFDAALIGTGLLLWFLAWVMTRVVVRINRWRTARDQREHDAMISGWNHVAKRLGLEVRGAWSTTFVDIGGSYRMARVVLGSYMADEDFRYEIDGRSSGALPKDLHIGSEGAFTSLVYDWGVDVQLGDPKFDRLVSVVGDEMTAFAALDAPTRAALVVLVSEHGARLEGGLLRVIKSGLIRDADELAALAEPLMAAAQGLTSATRGTLKAVIARSASDPMPGVRQRALEVLLSLLGQDSELPEVPERVARAFKKAASDSAPEVRRLVAEHPELLEEAQLELLLTDEDASVRQAIRASLGLEAEDNDGSLSLAEEAERAGELSLAQAAGQLSKPEGGG